MTNARASLSPVTNRWSPLEQLFHYECVHRSIWQTLNRGYSVLCATDHQLRDEHSQIPSEKNKTKLNTETMKQPTLTLQTNWHCVPLPEPGPPSTNTTFGLGRFFHDEAITGGYVFELLELLHRDFRVFRFNWLVNECFSTTNNSVFEPRVQLLINARKCIQFTPTLEKKNSQKPLGCFNWYNYISNYQDNIVPVSVGGFIGKKRKKNEGRKSWQPDRVHWCHSYNIGSEILPGISKMCFCVFSLDSWAVEPIVNYPVYCLCSKSCLSACLLALGVID